MEEWPEADLSPTRHSERMPRTLLQGTVQRRHQISVHEGVTAIKST